MNHSRTRKRVITAALGVGIVLGSAGIASALSSSPAATPPTDPPSTIGGGSTPASTSTGAGGVDQSNSDPTREAGESAQREADETAGKIGGGGHHTSNTDPAHEAAESPTRAAEEAARDASIANGTATTATGG